MTFWRIMSIMKQSGRKHLEYRILITPDTRVGSREQCFTAFVPALDIATSGDSVEEAFRNIKEMIAFHLECLKKEGEPLPVEHLSADFITTARVVVSV